MADVMDADMFNNLLNICKDAETDRERVRLLLSAGADEYFDADKVLAAVNQIIDSSERVSVAKGLFCRLVDLERSRKVCRFQPLRVSFLVRLNAHFSSSTSCNRPKH